MMQGKVVVITGASRGIGAAAAREFAAVGAKVVSLARSVGEIGKVVGGDGADEMMLACDVLDWVAVQRAVAHVVARFGRIDVLVNNAGVIEPIARLADADAGLWGQAVGVNLTGVFHGMKAVIPQMRM